MGKDKAAPSEEHDEAGGVKAKLDASTTISESTDYGDERRRPAGGARRIPQGRPRRRGAAGTARCPTPARTRC